MNLLANERVLQESSSKRLILTTHRVRYQVEVLGKAEIKSIMLEELASCAMVRSSNIILLVLAGGVFLLGVLAAANGPRNEGALGIAFIVAIAFLIAYFASRRQIIALASAGATISVSTKGMKVETIKQFIDQIEAAKNARYLLGRGI